ncbi:Integrator complex subunit 9 [Batrachochytrium dendrobatidis]|nr:Integrator complex subunit 9 [Batrachochytrium dendrobatidis]
MQLHRFEYESVEWLLLSGQETILIGCGLPRLNLHIPPTGHTLIPDVFRTLPWATIDLILVFSFQDITGLPFALMYTAFQGDVVCSEPTADFGRLRTLEWLSRCRNRKNIMGPKMLGWDVDLPFTETDVHRSFDKITRVRFGEKLHLGNIHVCGQSSGVVLGCTAWIVQVDNFKIGFVGDLSLSEGIPKRADLAGFDALDCVVSTANTTPRKYFHRLAKAINQIWIKIHKALSDHAAIVFISDLCGHMFDLVELVDRLLCAGGFDQTAIHMLSAHAKEAFIYANIQGEWMSDLRKTQLATASQPLSSATLENKMRLVYHSDVMSVARQPNPKLVIATDIQLAISAAELLDSTRVHDWSPADVIDWMPLLLCPTELAMTSLEVQHAASQLHIRCLILSKQDIPSTGLSISPQHEQMRYCTIDGSIASHTGWSNTLFTPSKRHAIAKPIVGFLKGKMHLGTSKVIATSSGKMYGDDEALRDPKHRQELIQTLTEKILDATVLETQDSTIVSSKTLGTVTLIHQGRVQIQALNIQGLQTLRKLVAQ